MKKILIILFLLPIALAEEEIKISLIEYNTETNFARIQIENYLQQDLHNVEFQINTLPPRPIATILKSGTSTARLLTVPPGLHTITVKSDETTVSKELSFQASVEEKLAEYEETQREKRRESQREKSLEYELEKNKPVTQEESKGSVKIIVSIIILLVIAIIVYIIWSKRKHETL